jgi:hypothetical protein
MAVKGLGHRHQVLALNLEHLSQIELGVPSVLCLGPQGTTTPSQPRIEFNKLEISLTDVFFDPYQIYVSFIIAECSYKK